MVASLWSGSWIASQLPLNQIEATAPNVRKIRYVILGAPTARNDARRPAVALQVGAGLAAELRFDQFREVRESTVKRLMKAGLASEPSYH